MSEKDFLSQFSNTDKPDSFKEEERIPVKKDHSGNIKTILIVLLILLILIGGVLFFLFRPKIEVKDFVGMNASEVSAWIRQNDIDTQGIVFRKEYDFDHDEDIVISQSIDAGKKVTKKAKMDFVISMGADPDEKIAVPDIESFTKTQVQNWIDTNKLQKTKISSTYDDEVPADSVIKVEFKGCDESTFTRGSQLTVIVSKGPQPKTVVKCPNFVGSYYSEAESWAKQNKIRLIKVERYSNSTEMEKVISQTVDEGKELEEGDSLTVYVSIGTAVYAPNLIGCDENYAANWSSSYGKSIMTKEEYHASIKQGIIFYQSIEEGAIVKDGFSVTVSMGNPTFPVGSSGNEYPSTINGLKAWIEDVNGKNANISLGEVTYRNDDNAPVGTIIEDITVVPVGTKLNVTVSKGRNIFLQDYHNDDTGVVVSWKDIADKTHTEEDVRNLIMANCSEEYTLAFEIRYIESKEVEPSYVVKAYREDGEKLEAGSYISEDTKVIFEICERKVVEE